MTNDTVSRLTNAPRLPIDIGGNAIPAMRQRPDGAHTIAASASSARNSTAFNESTNIISVYAAVDIYMRWGDSSVEATSNDHFYPAGVYYDFAVDKDHTHLAVLRASSDGNVYLSEKY